ncbi:MAG: hypothetical protein ACKVLA_16465 [Rhodobacterales bacterium]
MIHSTFLTGGDHVADLTVISNIHLVDLGDGVFEARLLCTDPNGQISHMTFRVYWFFGRPEIDMEQVMIDGDARHGAAFAARYADLLHPALIAWRMQSLTPTTQNLSSDAGPGPTHRDRILRPATRQPSPAQS